MNTDYDILIIGGGLVGASLASALARQPLRIGIVEAKPLNVAGQTSGDERAITLAHSTAKIFSTIGVWDRMVVEATPIHRIHISDRGRFGSTHLDREEEGVDALGYVVPARSIGSALMDYLKLESSVDMICPAQLTGVDVSDEHVTAEISLNGERKTLTAPLLIAADGAQSIVREQLELPVDRWDYKQTAVVASIATQLPHQNVAYERFTESGPLAVLPRVDGRCTIVWTVANDQLDQALSCSDATFVAKVQEQFGYRLGRLDNPGKRHVFPLQLVRARQSVSKRVALVGNAAHTLHPIAGQGFNLGVRDVAVLAEVLVDALQNGSDIGGDEVLNQYAQWRKRDHKRVTAFTDGLTRLFANPLSSVAMLRNLGMLALDVAPPAKSLFTRLTMGRSGKLPRLSRGLSL